MDRINIDNNYIMVTLLSLCNGKYTMSQIMTVYQQGYMVSANTTEEEITNIIKKYQDFLTAIPLPLENPRFQSLPAIILNRTKPWPYHQLREETPYRIELSLTGACNHRCTYCFQSCDFKKTKELDLRQWMKVLEQAGTAGVLEVIFTGGEPTLYNGILSLIKKAVSLDIYPVINTNGTLLSNEMLDSLKKAGLEFIHMSLPAIHNPAFAKITG